MAETNSVLVIEEINPSGTAGARVELRGSGLPKQGASWPGKQPVVTTWYVGNPNATQQTLGPVEMPSAWEGEWHRTMLGRTPARVTAPGEFAAVSVVNPHVLMEVMEGIRIRGQRLRVTSSQRLAEDAFGQDVLIAREGRLSQFECPVKRLEDIEWKATFDWASRGGDSQKSVPLRDGASSAAFLAYQTAADALAVQLDALKLKSANGLGPTPFSLAQLSKFASYPNSVLQSLGRQVQQNAQRLADLVSVGQQIAYTPQQLASTAASIAQNTLAIVNQTKQQLNQTPAELYSTNTRASDVARAARQVGLSLEASDAVAQAALNLLEDSLRKLGALSARDALGSQALGGHGGMAAGGVQQLYKTKQGDTTTKLSMKFYSTPDFAAAIAKANHLPWHTTVLDPGMVIVVPANPSGV